MAELNLSNDDVAAIAAAVAEKLSEHLSTVRQGQAPGRLYSEQDAAKQLGVSPNTLKRWRLAGLVESHTTRRPIRYKAEHIAGIEQWMRDRHQ